MSAITTDDLFGTPAKSKTGSNGHKITCRIIAVREAELLRMLGIHNASRAAYSVYRRLSRKNPELIPSDVACAVREVRPMAELWIDEVAASLDRLRPHSLRRPVYRRRYRRLTWPQPRPHKAETRPSA
jgi:hypothetical protein